MLDILIWIGLSVFNSCDSLSTLTWSKENVNIVVGSASSIILRVQPPVAEDTTVVFTYQIGNVITNQNNPQLIGLIPDIIIQGNKTEVVVNITASSSNAGSLILGVNSSSPYLTNLDTCVVKITVVHMIPLIAISAVVGWIYFLAWSVASYPQIFLNWKRKSVVGLSLEIPAYNITGYVAYGLFNVGMFWINTIKVGTFALENNAPIYKHLKKIKNNIAGFGFLNHKMDLTIDGYTETVIRCDIMLKETAGKV